MRCKEQLKDRGTISKDALGRSINISFEVEGQRWYVVNIYAPNDAKQRQEFFALVNDELQKCCEGMRVVAGDFNNVLDEQLDRTKPAAEGKRKTDSSRESLRRII